MVGIKWLDVHYRTLFCLAADGRIERVNDPDRSPGPRFWLGGCAKGNILGVHVDLPDDIAAELENLAAAEPPFILPAAPRYLDGYLAVLAGHRPVARHNLSLIYELPHSLPYTGHVRLIDSDCAEARDLTQCLSIDGMPKGLSELGFCNVSHFWPPWSVAVVDGEIASIAFAARLSDAGAEIGVTTVRSFRGRGFAAAVTAGWSSLPSLRSQTLFYSTDQKNISSQRVAARLGLRLGGSSLQIL
jgi:hypothetical protein